MQDENNVGLVPDYHIHTTLCRHARGEAQEYKEAAKRKRVPEICFSDHCPTPDGFDLRHRMTMAQAETYREWVFSLQDSSNPSVLYGVEADYYEGCEGFLTKWLPSQAFDLVLGSVHFINGWGFDDPDYTAQWESVDVKTAWSAYFDRVVKMADSGLFHVVGHLDLPKKFGHRLADGVLREMAKPVLDRIALAGMGIELNTSGLRKPVGEIYPSGLLLGLAWERGIPICFGSDAHAPEDVGAGFGEAISLAKEAGYRHYFKIRQGKKALVGL